MTQPMRARQMWRAQRRPGHVYSSRRRRRLRAPLTTGRPADWLAVLRKFENINSPLSSGSLAAQRGRRRWAAKGSISFRLTEAPTRRAPGVDGRGLAEALAVAVNQGGRIVGVRLARGRGRCEHGHPMRPPGPLMKPLDLERSSSGLDWRARRRWPAGWASPTISPLEPATCLAASAPASLASAGRAADPMPANPSGPAQPDPGRPRNSPPIAQTSDLCAPRAWWRPQRVLGGANPSPPAHTEWGCR